MKYSLPLLLVALALSFGGSASPCPAQEVESNYGPLPVFEFHSGFWVNLHQFLYHQAREKLAVKNSKPGSTPVLKQTPISLSPAEQKAWDEAVAYYQSNFADKDPQVNIDQILLRNQLGDFEDCSELLGKSRRTCDAGLPGNVGVILGAAATVYRAHWWQDQDRANRRWVVRVAPLIREQGVGLSQRLADIFQSTWPREKIRVEICAFAGPAGAFTTLDPLRVTISSTAPRNQGNDSLEVLFHEASHGIAIPVETAITRECRQRDKPIPRDLWHALIFYTTDEVIRPIMPEAPTSVPQEAPGNKSMPMPPDLNEKLTERGWAEYLRLLHTFWQPYLDGKVTFGDAIAHLVSAA